MNFIKVAIGKMYSEYMLLCSFFFSKGSAYAVQHSSPQHLLPN